MAKSFNFATAMASFNRVLGKEHLEECVRNAFEDILSQMRDDVLDIGRKGRWNDITGNLTKSIVFLVVKPMSSVSEGNPEGQITVTNTDSTMIFGFLVAGMSYAINVELRDNRDVLKGTAAKWRNKIPRILISDIQQCIRARI